MKIVAFSDWRVQPMDVLFEIIKDIDNVDAVVYAGDDLDRFDNSFFLENIRQKLHRHEDSDKSYISKCEAEIFYYAFSQCPDIISEDELKKLAIFEINTKKCKTGSWVFRDIVGSRFRPSDGQFDTIKYKLKVGIESGRVMDIDGHKIIVFKLDNQSDIFPEIDFSNIFRALSEKANAPVLGVIGNDDTEECGKTFIGDNVFNIHKDPIKIGKQYFLGIQGVICDDGSFKKWVKYKELNALRREIEDFYTKSLLKKHCNDVAFPELIGHVAIGESDAKKHLERKNKKCDKPPIIVSHTPPYGVLDIGRRFGIEHIGSVELRDFVLKNKIPLVICGHVHGYGGYIENIGKTTVVNVSSHDRLGSEGNIAIIDYEDTVKVKWIKVSDYDRSLRKIKDIGIYREALLRSNGVNTIDDLLNCTDDFLTSLKTRLLTSLELKKIFSTAENGEEELILTLLFKYNLSEEEFEKLTLKELDFDSKAIHFRKSHGKGEKRSIYLDNKTYSQLIDYTYKRHYIYCVPIFFSSKEDRATIERLYKKLNNVVNSFCKPIKPKGGIGKL